MNKLFKWVSSTGGWIALPIILGCLVVLYGSVIFHWNNFYSKNVHAASGWWHLTGWVLTGAAILWAFTKLDRWGSIVLFGICLALSFCAFAGFNFSIA